VHGNIYCYNVRSVERIRCFRNRRGVFHTPPLGSDGLADLNSSDKDEIQGERIDWPEDLLPAAPRKKRETPNGDPGDRFSCPCRIRVSADGRTAATGEYVYRGAGDAEKC
jgi:hypothetical protein